MRRNGEDNVAGSLEGARRGGRQFITGLDVLVEKVSVKHQLVAADFIGGIPKTAVPLRIRQRFGIGVVVEENRWTAGVDVVGSWGLAVGEEGRVSENKAVAWRGDLRRRNAGSEDGCW